MKTAIKHILQGESFGARGCSSCTCNPCDCNPCTCGDSRAPSYPEWRISGYSVTHGTIDGVDVSQQCILSLTRPIVEGHYDAWQEVILLPDTADDEQLRGLIAAFEPILDSMPAEAGSHLRRPPAIYQTRIICQHESDAATLQVSFDPLISRLIRADSHATILRPWFYRGAIAMRGTFDTAK